MVGRCTLKNPRYPVFIVSKGRWNSCLTARALDRMGVPFIVIVEGQEYEKYAETIGRKRVWVLPKIYQSRYETCDELGDSKSKGPGAARNFCLNYARSNNHKRHWVLDDNLEDFHRLNRNIKAPVRTSATFRAAEDFVDRYSNVPIAGFNYYSFCKATDKVPPYVLNTRIYSCLLIASDIKHEWNN
jgi:hypothetical protein